MGELRTRAPFRGVARGRRDQISIRRVRTPAAGPTGRVAGSHVTEVDRGAARCGGPPPVRRFGAAVLLALFCVVAACVPAPPPAPDGFDSRYVTRDGTDVYRLAPLSQGMRFQAPPSNRGQNSRLILWRSGEATSWDHGACATFEHSGWPVQEGVALRISPDGRRAISAMKNIFGFGTWLYNVQLLDLSKPEGAGRITPARLGLDFSGALDGTSGPRRLCARVAGQVVAVKVWLAGQPEPAWSDPIHVREVQVPPEWVYPGRSGLYVGHLPPGGFAQAVDWSASDG